jgi:ribonuclease-3
VLGLVRDRLDALVEAPGVPDAKSRLQELASRDLHTEIRYDVAEVGPEHDKTFTAVAVVGGRLLGRGSGRSKKEAEQVAANEALLSLAAEPDGLRAAAPRTQSEDQDA